MSNTQAQLAKDSPLGARIGYAELAIRLIAGVLVLLVSIGFFFLPSLKNIWLGLSVFIFIGLVGPGVLQISMAARASRREGEATPLAATSGPLVITGSNIGHLSHEVSYDKLTGLSDRAFIEDRMAHDKARADRSGTGFALFFISHDNFQQLENQLGRGAGEKALVAAAKSLADSLRPTDTVARWGDNELIVLIPDILSMDAAKSVAEKLSKSVRQIFSGTTAETITFSIGVAVYPNDANSVGKLFSKADQALKNAKSLGQNNIQYASEPSGPMVWGT